MEKKPYYISTAIAYTSAKPHIGNTYEIVLADAIARYKRMTGYEIAAILGIKPASVATLLSKARRQLLSDIRKRNQRT